ncbi:hypothetical protein OIU76_010011 [Salix suchowensis]|nr:hypothetical protein OIU76_010011 [Salix suchowensis]
MQVTTSSSGTSSATPSLTEPATFIANQLQDSAKKKEYFVFFPFIFCIIQRGSCNISPSYIRCCAAFCFLFFLLKLVDKNCVLNSDDSFAIKGIG